MGVEGIEVMDCELILRSMSTRMLSFPCLGLFCLVINVMIRFMQQSVVSMGCWNDNKSRGVNLITAALKKETKFWRKFYEYSMSQQHSHRSVGLLRRNCSNYPQFIHVTVGAPTKGKRGIFHEKGEII